MEGFDVTPAAGMEGLSAVYAMGRDGPVRGIMATTIIITIATTTMLVTCATAQVAKG